MTERASCFCHGFLDFLEVLSALSANAFRKRVSTINDRGKRKYDDSAFYSYIPIPIYAHVFVRNGWEREQTKHHRYGQLKMSPIFIKCGHKEKEKEREILAKSWW